MIGFVLTLNVPKFLTEHAIRTFLPAGTVTFSMISVNSGSSANANWERKRLAKTSVTKKNSIEN